MDALLSLFSGAQNILLLIGAAIVAGVGLLAKGRIDGARAERDKHKAKEADAYAKHLDDIAKAADAGNRVSGRVPVNDPYNRDPRPQG